MNVNGLWDASRGVRLYTVALFAVDALLALNSAHCTEVGKTLPGERSLFGLAPHSLGR
jgi:hypothetical protein